MIQHDYYTLDDAAYSLKCDKKDLLQLAADGKIKLSLYLKDEELDCFFKAEDKNEPKMHFHVHGNYGIPDTYLPIYIGIYDLAQKRAAELLNTGHTKPLMLSCRDGEVLVTLYGVPKDFYSCHTREDIKITREELEKAKSIIQPINNQADISNINQLADKPLIESERSKMLAVILGMAMDKYDYDPQATKNKATGEKAGSICQALKDHGLKVSNDAIADYLQAAIKRHPNAKPRKV